jgi:hypothetical protein
MTDLEDEMHELGNAIAALQFCFSQLNGRRNRSVSTPCASGR